MVSREYGTPVSAHARSRRGCDLVPRRPAVPALQRRAQSIPRGHEQDVATARDPGASGLADERQRPSEVRHGLPTRGDSGPRAGELGDPALDPRAQLPDRGGGLALGRTARQHDLDPSGRVDRDAHAACPV